MSDVPIYVPGGGGGGYPGSYPIVNADIAAAAGIVKSKLAALGIVDADVNAISAGKITGLPAAYPGAYPIGNADIAAAAGIVKSKLAALGIVDADVNAISAGKITGLPAAYPGAYPIVNADIAAAADIANSKLAPLLTVTSLPGSPVDGQEIYYLADATNGIVWHLKYRSASLSTYKWEWVGGASLNAFIDTATAGTTSTTYVDLSGPSLTLPLAGDYEITIGAWLTANVTGVSYATMINSAWTASDADAIGKYDAAFAWDGPYQSTRYKTASSGTLALYYKSNAAGVMVFAKERRIIAKPIRVG